MELDPKVIEFYEYFNYDLVGLIRSDTYHLSEYDVKVLILLNYKHYIGIENLDTYTYQKEMYRLITLSRKKRIDEKLKKMMDLEEKLFVLQKEKVDNILQKTESYLNEGTRKLHPLINEFDPLLEYINAKINQLEVFKLGERDEIKDLELLEKINYKLALLYELGIIELLQKRFEENSLSTTGKELAKMIGYIINEGEASIIKYLTNLDLKGKARNKSKVFTKKAINEMYRSMRDCNLQVKVNYDKVKK